MSGVPLQEVLGSQLTRILEEAAFMLVEDSEAPLPNSGPAVEAKLNFSGKHSGTCWLSVSEDGANHLAREMLGDERAPDALQARDAAAELLNILTAWILDVWWGKDVEHTMGIPNTTCTHFEQTTAWNLPAGQRVIVSTDAGYTFICGITLER